MLDYSPLQLESERLVAERESYDIQIIRGDMTKRLPFDDDEFDLIFHPVSNCYVEEVRPIWKECFRILKPGGYLLSGTDHYINYIVDSEEKQIINRLPFNPLINTDQMQQLEAEDAGVQFSHTDSIRTIQRAHDDEASHTIGASRKDAGAFLRTGCEKHVNEMSKEVMQSFVDLSTLPERLTNTDTVAVEYLNNQDIWCRARFLAAARDTDGKVIRVLWLLESIDEEKKDREKLKALSETDPMTGVRSKHAWLLKEKELNNIIDSGNAGEFAVVVCDVNGLKKINDTYGHKAGDEYIREACKMVCEIFQHSQVYRVGGDEFTVILTERDYAIRRELMITLHDRSSESMMTHSIRKPDKATTLGTE